MTNPTQPKGRWSEASRSFNEALGAKVKAFRLGARMSQTELGAHLGVSFQQVQKYETGRDRCSAYMLQRISTLLAVPITVFFEGYPVPVGDSPDVREAMKTVLVIQKIKDPKLRRTLLTLIEELARAETKTTVKP